MKQILTLLLILTAQIIYAQQSIIRVTLADVKTKEPLQAYIAEYDGSDIDTATVINGAFSFSRKIDHPRLFRLAVQTAKEEPVLAVRFFAEPGEMNLTLAAKGAESYTIHYDSKSQKLFESFYKQFSPLAKLWQYSASETYNTKLSASEIAIHRTVIANIEKIQQQVVENFIVENTDNIVGAYVFSWHMRKTKISEQDSIYKLFDPALHNSTYLRDMKAWITSAGSLQLNQPVPTFETISSKKEWVKLSDLKGKYLVIDFWGSWCTPCIAGFPKMKTYYEKYRSKIEFLSVACNDTPETWTKALAKYKLPWIQVLNDKNSDDLTVKYLIDTYPTKVLIDPAGKLINVFQGEGDDFYNQLDKLFK